MCAPGAVAKHIFDYRAVGEAEHVVEVAGRILRVAARVRAAEHRDGSPLAVHVAHGVREMYLYLSADARFTSPFSHRARKSLLTCSMRR